MPSLDRCAGHAAGPLFESLVTLGVRVCAQAAGASVHHLRRSGGDREVDLLVEAEVLPIEVKLAPTVDDRHARHLLRLRKQHNPQQY